MLDKGEVSQFDKPHILLQNVEGIFYQMVKQTGVQNAQILHRMARLSYDNACNNDSTLLPVKPEMSYVDADDVGIVKQTEMDDSYTNLGLQEDIEMTYL